MIEDDQMTEKLDASERWARREDLALLTDYYQLTMMGGYWKSGRQDLTACFNYVFRDLPSHNGFAVFAGVAQLLDLVEKLQFTEHDLAYLRSLGTFDGAFLDYLRGFRPRCSIQSVPEGTVVFPHEPLLQVQAPLIVAQLFETVVLNALNFQTLIATKAARIRLACGSDDAGGVRAAPRTGAGWRTERVGAAYIGGADATSNVLAGKLFGIPVRGTHAHSWVMSFDDELVGIPSIRGRLPRPHPSR